MRIIRYNQPLNRRYTPAIRGIHRSPWAGLENEIDRLFTAAADTAVGHTSSQFPVDLYEDENNAFVRAELPGISREDIQVELADGHLTIKATRKTGEGDEATTTEYSRAITVPDTVQADQVGATSENGVLTVTLPKREESKPRKITVAVK